MILSDKEVSCDRQAKACIKKAANFVWLLFHVENQACLVFCAALYSATSRWILSYGLSRSLIEES